MNKSAILLADWNLYQLTLFHLLYSATKQKYETKDNKSDIHIRLSIARETANIEEEEIYLQTVVISSGSNKELNRIKSAENGNSAIHRD